jgi:hypothetical protein
MLKVVADAVDQRIEKRLLAAARHTWPVLHAVPSAWLRPVLVPSAKRLRRSLARGLLAITLTGGAALVVLSLVH